jgi:PAS domain-containing protein
MGMVLLAGAAVVPSAGQPSLVIDDALRICAVSRAAESLLHIDEADAVGQSLAAVLLPAQAEGGGLDGLVAAVLSAAVGDGTPERAVVRPAGEWGVRYAVRIGACGPPRAALLVLDDDEV